MFTQTAEYALRAMIYLASLGPEAVSSERIARFTRIPAGYLSKVMRAMVVADLVGSRRGPRGGFSLARSADTISLLDVIRAIDRDQALAPHGVRKEPPAAAGRRPDRLDRVVADWQESLRVITLAELTDDARGCGPYAA